MDEEGDIDVADASGVLGAELSGACIGDDIFTAVPGDVVVYAALKRLQRDGQDWFQLFYGNYPSAELARLAQQNLPASLPAQRSRLWPL